MGLEELSFLTTRTAHSKNTVQLASFGKNLHGVLFGTNLKRTKGTKGDISHISEKKAKLIFIMFLYVLVSF
ncbi:MAG: hypothetical protein Crog4KO_24940 [Crocinitomicaceae bacterium]